MRSTWSPMGWMCALLLWGAIGYVNGLPVKTDTESAFGDAENVIVPMQPANERPSMKVVSSIFDDIEEGLSAIIGYNTKDLAIQPANYRPSMEVGSAIIYPHGPPLTGGNPSIIGDDKKDLAIQRENYRPSMEVGKSLFDDAAEIANGIVNTNVRPLEFIAFYARKAILLRWGETSPPTVRQWRTLINTALPLYKLTYMGRNCPEPIYEGIAEIANSFSDDGEERLLKLIKFNNSPSE